MPVEGISMTTVFSLVTVGMALSISVFIGANYLQPSLDIAKVLAGVAYDIATLYDIAYTMPGEVTMKYYGPSSCMWNYNQASNSSRSFHCFSGQVVIDGVYVDKELLFVYNDSYMKYDYELCQARGGWFCVAPDALTRLRPAYGMVRIPYFNPQLCSTEGGLENCDEATAEFATSYKDYSFITSPVESIKVKDYSFVVNKVNVEDYYQTVEEFHENPVSLKTYLICLTELYRLVCNGATPPSTTIQMVVSGPSVICQTIGLNLDEDADFKIREGYRWHIYNNRQGQPTVICQERLSIDNYTIGEQRYVSDINFTMLLNNYTTDFCFDINTIKDRQPCSAVASINFTNQMVNWTNNMYDYHASLVSCLNPILTYNISTGKIVLDTGTRLVRYNQFAGDCA